MLVSGGVKGGYVGLLNERTYWLSIQVWRIGSEGLAFQKGNWERS